MNEEYEALDLRNALPWLQGGWKDRIRGMLDTMLSLDRVRQTFAVAARIPGEPFQNAVRQFGLELRIHGMKLPEHGPLCVFANHPFGGADAIALGAACSAQRPDSLLLANELATVLPGVGKRMLPLSILGDTVTKRSNSATLRRALTHLKSGGCLIAFPSGEVARRLGGQVIEGPWSAHLAALAAKTGACVIPAHFIGEAPGWFYLSERIHPMLRTALIPKLLAKQRGWLIELRVGDAIRLDPADDMETCASRLREAVLALGSLSM